MYQGDYAEDATLDFIWNSSDGSGASITRSTDGTVSVYKANGTTQSTAGITDTEDFDGLTGVHHVRIDLSADAFYAIGNDYMVVLSAATIDGQTVNAVLGTFSIENRFSEVDVTKLGGGAQSLTDLKDFADAGYDPATNKVQGVVLVDTTTANSDMRGTDSVDTATMRGTDSGALASICTEARLAELDGANLPAVTDGIQTDLSNGTDGLGALKTLIDTVNTDLSNGTDGLSALKTLIDAVKSAIDTDTISELAQAIPATNPTLKEALMLLYMALRNKNNSSATEMGLFNDAGTKIAKSALSDSAGTFTNAKLGSGA